MLWGTDIFVKLQLSLDFEKRGVVKNGKLLTTWVDDSHSVHVAANFVIEPFCHQFLPVKIDTMRDGDFIIEGGLGDSIWIVPTLCNVVKGETQVPIVNAVQNRFSLRKDVVLGEGSAVKSNKRPSIAVVNKMPIDSNSVKDLSWGSLPINSLLLDNVLGFLQKFSEVVSFHDWDVGRAKVGEHSIELQDNYNSPIKQKLCPLNSAQL